MVKEKGGKEMSREGEPSSQVAVVCWGEMKRGSAGVLAAFRDLVVIQSGTCKVQTLTTLPGLKPGAKMDTGEGASETRVLTSCTVRTEESSLSWEEVFSQSPPVLLMEKVNPLPPTQVSFTILCTKPGG